MIRQRRVFSAVLALITATGFLSAQTVQLTGRILEKAAIGPVAGATVRLKGYNLVTTTDTAGRFTLSGNPASTQPRRLIWNAVLMERGMLRVQTVAAGVNVKTGLFDSQGKSLDQSIHRLAGAGAYSLPVLKNAPRNAVLFLKVSTGDETYRFRLFQGAGVASASHAAFIPGEGALARTAAANDSIEITITGLITKRNAAAANGDLGDIVMDYPARDSAGVGAKRPYGAIVLFDGTQGPAAAQAELLAKWLDWRDWPNGYSGTNWQTSTKNTSPPTFKIAKDPEFPNDTNRVTLRSDSVTGISSYAWRWGYDDIEVKPQYVHRDVQLHVEWMAMGVYSAADPENANTTATYNSTATAAHYVNSGVYVQNRYEIQIQSNALGAAITDCHAMGSVVNEFAPSATFGGGSGTTCNGTGMFSSPCPNCANSANVLKGNGVWQSYDITFRASRYNGATKTADGYLSMWWNGQLVHYNRRVLGLATGLSNTSGEAMDSAVYGLKLQRERGDVRFRNVWMKHLKIDSTNTAFGY